MASVNSATIIGNIGHELELKYSKSGMAMLNMRVATSEQWTDKESKEKKEETTWHNIVSFGKQAENCSQYLHKGSQVYVEGRIRTRKWQDKEGNDKYTTEIVAQTVQFLGGKSSANGTEKTTVPHTAEQGEMEDVGF